jgi:hypothetical protein
VTAVDLITASVALRTALVAELRARFRCTGRSIKGIAELADRPRAAFYPGVSERVTEGVAASVTGAARDKHHYAESDDPEGQACTRHEALQCFEKYLSKSKMAMAA